MDNQHKHLNGYRDLSADEIELMNEIKTKGAELEALINKVKGSCRLQFDDAQHGTEELARLNAANPYLWIAVARTHLQDGVMALTRAVKQPTI